jgi:hypothetical protein
VGPNGPIYENETHEELKIERESYDDEESTAFNADHIFDGPPK